MGNGINRTRPYVAGVGADHVGNFQVWAVWVGRCDRGGRSGRLIWSSVLGVFIFWVLKYIIEVFKIILGTNSNRLTFLI
jgi:hypothetical protein